MNFLFFVSISTILGYNSEERRCRWEQRRIREKRERAKINFCLRKNLTKQNVEQLCSLMWEKALEKSLFSKIINETISSNNLEDNVPIYTVWKDNIISLIDGNKMKVREDQTEIFEIVKDFGFDTYDLLQQMNLKLDLSKLGEEINVADLINDMANCILDEEHENGKRLSLPVYNETMVKEIMETRFRR